MKQERWKLLESATTFIINDSAVKDALSKEARINLWLAQKQLGKINLEEVRAYDFSASTMDYRICQSALLEEYDKCVELVEKALDTEQFSLDCLYDWPVLKEFRESKQFKNFMIENEIKEPSMKQQLIYPNIEEHKSEETYIEKS